MSPWRRRRPRPSARAEPNAALYGSMPVLEAIATCQEVLARAEDDRKARALASSRSGSSRRCGEFRGARLSIAERASLEEFGWLLAAALTSLDSSVIELLAGDLATAESELRTDYRRLEEMGKRDYISTTAGLLADVLYRQGRYDESAEFAGICETSSSGGIGDEFLWRCVRGKLRARQGAIERPSRCCRRRWRSSKLRTSLTCRVTGCWISPRSWSWPEHPADAAALGDQAAMLFERKGNVVSARRARQLAERLRGIITRRGQNDRARVTYDVLRLPDVRWIELGWALLLSAGAGQVTLVVYAFDTGGAVPRRHLCRVPHSAQHGRNARPRRRFRPASSQVRCSPGHVAPGGIPRAGGGTRGAAGAPAAVIALAAASSALPAPTGLAGRHLAVARPYLGRAHLAKVMAAVLELGHARRALLAGGVLVARPRPRHGPGGWILASLSPFLLGLAVPADLPQRPKALVQVDGTWRMASPSWLGHRARRRRHSCLPQTSSAASWSFSPRGSP